MRLLERVQAGLRRDGPAGFDGGFKEVDRIEIGEMAEHAMRGQDAKAGRVHVDQRHHDELRGRVVGIFVAIGERGFVAVMTVRDQEFFVGHQGLNLRDAGWVGNRPQAVAGVVVIEDVEDRSGGGGLIEKLIDLALAGRDTA